MDPVERAACVIFGVFAVLFSWKGFRRRTPTATSTATSELSTSHIHEACRIHSRWSGANDLHVACFDLFEILQTDAVSFSGDADAFAAVVGPAIDDNTRRDDEKIQVMLLSYEYLYNDSKRAVYVSQLMPLIAEQRQASKLDCRSNVPFPACTDGPPHTLAPGAMDRACGW